MLTEHNSLFIILWGCVCEFSPLFPVFKVGGRYDNGLVAGLLARNANNASSNANANNGGRLLVSDLCSIAHARSMPLGKNIAARTGLSRLLSKGLEANKEGVANA